MPLRLLLWLVLFLPTIFFFFGLGSSLAAGVGATAAIVLMLGLSVPGEVRSGVFRGLALTVPIVIFVLIHLLGAATFLPIDFGRSLGSLVLLVVTIAAGVVLGRIFFLSPDRIIARAIFFCFLVLCGSAALGIAGVRVPSPRPYSQPVFPFTEPSHFALVMTPVLMFCCIWSRGWKRAILIGIGLAIAFALQSLTMVVALVSIVFVSARGLLFPAAAVVAAIAGSLLDLAYYTDRLDLSNTNNMSVLVFVQGWQLAIDGFLRSFGWGVGFQQLGLHGAHVSATDLLYLLVGNEVNLLDGGLTFAKLSGEFGVFGIALSAVFVIIAGFSVFRLRKLSRATSQLEAAKTFAYCIMMAYPIELFVRGLGYFTPTFLLVIAALRVLQDARALSVRKLNAELQPAAR
jgi:hypothetical protein